MTFLRNAAAAAAIAITTLAGLAAPAGADPAPKTAEAQATSTDGQSKTSTAGLSSSLFANTPVQRASSSAKPELAAANCWNGRTSGGRNFFMTCRARSYHVYVDCTNGRHLFPETFSGQWNFRLTCPAGTRAVWGGSW
ncbi:hypothetical protein [Streptomyces colonosanans]|uniref:Chitin-binding type-2 domain-containing protein n=1 Tax=Streptomyces colonosanans TaxID=1428652 RepID=A0A1S2P280_9ACTN|nr:hypothetical protein [Streptomyces colonosanans]OIJ87903.1 hypothetical protein BIV24_24015 [Streptomyces colonosanans]